MGRNADDSGSLGGRQRFTGSDATLWDSDNGTILGLPAHATKNASGLVVGDFSTSVIGVFGPGMRIDIDPSQDFNSAGLVARVMLMCDVAFPQPAAFWFQPGDMMQTIRLAAIKPVRLYGRHERDRDEPSHGSASLCARPGPVRLERHGATALDGAAGHAPAATMKNDGRPSQLVA